MFLPCNPASDTALNSSIVKTEGPHISLYDIHWRATIFGICTSNQLMEQSDASKRSGWPYA